MGPNCQSFGSSIVLDASPGVDNTVALQAQIDAAPDGTAENPTIISMPGGADYRVDGTIRINSRSHLHFVGPYRQYTDLYGWEADGHRCEVEESCTSAEWLEGGTRWVAGQSLRSHWAIDALGEGAASHDLEFRDLHLRGPESPRREKLVDGIMTTLPYSHYDDEGELKRSIEAEHGFAVGGQSSTPECQRLKWVGCTTKNTGGDGWMIAVGGGVLDNEIELRGCSSLFANRHAVGVVDVSGLLVTGFHAEGAASAFVDMEANTMTARLRDIRILDCECDVYRIPILCQGSGQEDLTIEDLTILAHGFGAPVWYPMVKAGYFDAGSHSNPPAGAITIRNTQPASGVAWDQSTGDAIEIENWPTEILEGNYPGEPV